MQHRVGEAGQMDGDAQKEEQHGGAGGEHQQQQNSASPRTDSATSGTQPDHPLSYGRRIIPARTQKDAVPFRRYTTSQVKSPHRGRRYVVAPIEAIFQGGVFKPLDEVELPENQRLRLEIEPIDAEYAQHLASERVRKHQQEMLERHAATSPIARRTSPKTGCAMSDVVVDSLCRRQVGADRAGLGPGQSTHR